MTDIRLRHLKKDDVEKMLEWMHDSSINKWFRFDFSSMTVEKVENFIENSFDNKNQHFAIIDKNDEYLGTISLKNISYVNKNAEYAIVLRKVAQGRGVSSLATRQILEYAFEKLNLHKVYLNVLANNTIANKFYAKCGFVKEGTFRDCLFLNDKYEDLNWYCVVKE